MSETVIKDAITGRDEIYIVDDKAYNAITGQQVGVLQNGEYISFPSGKSVAMFVSSAPDIDLSGVTASSGTVLEGYKFVDKTGSLIEGSIAVRSASTDAPGAVTFPAGYYPESFDAFIIAGNVAAADVTPRDIRNGKVFIGTDGFLNVGTMPELPEQTITPGSDPVVIPAGNYLAGNQVIEAVQSSGGMEFYQCASIAAGGASWSGHKATQGADGSWSFAEAVTNDLTVAGYYPVVGRIYNQDTTVWARDLFVQQEGKMVLLLSFEKKVAGNMDDTDTCFIHEADASRYQMPYSSIPKLFGDYAISGIGYTDTRGIKTRSLPEMDEFTLEFYFSSSSDFYFGGYHIIYMPPENGKIQITLEVSKDTTGDKLLKNIWHHCAYVRRRGTGIVTVYVDGVKHSDIQFDKPIGGSRLTTIGSGTSGYVDQLAIFNYAKYTSDFTPDYKEYLPIVSGLNQFDYPTREVGVSGCACRFVNNKSYALMDSSATGTNRVWASSDGKYYIRYEWETWYLTDSLGYSENAITYASLSVPMDPDTWMPLDIDPIGYPDWKDNFTNQPISVVYNS